MDELDQKLIAILSINARESFSEIARNVGSSRSTVQDRIARLEQRGIIKGYRAVLDEKTDSRPIRAFVLVSVQPQKTTLIVAELKALNAVRSVYTVSGEFDLMVEVGTTDTQTMDEMLDKLGEIPGVQKTESSIILSTRLHR